MPSPATTSAFVLLTSPHRWCDPAENPRLTHMCDRAAGPASALLVDALQAAGVDVVHLEGNTLRKEKDLNRDPTVGMAEPARTFYKEYNTLLANKPPALVLDVHSYPPDLHERRHGGKEDRAWTKSDMVLLDNKPKENARFTRGLSKKLAEEKIKTLHVRGSPVNYIIRRADEMNIPSTLLEFNERLLRPENKTLLNQIIRAIVEYVKSAVNRKCVADALESCM